MLLTPILTLRGTLTIVTDHRGQKNNSTNSGKDLHDGCANAAAAARIRTSPSSDGTYHACFKSGSWPGWFGNVGRDEVCNKSFKMHPPRDSCGATRVEDG